MSSILQFFDSAIEDEARTAFLIVGYFVRQHSKNTTVIFYQFWKEIEVFFATFYFIALLLLLLSTITCGFLHCHC